LFRTIDTVVEEKPLSFATSRIVTMRQVSKFQSCKVSKLPLQHFGPGNWGRLASPFVA
jgi:hypothetical protein